MSENNSASEAREQANAYKSIFSDRTLRFDDGTTLTIPPHPNLRMMDDDVLEAYEAYLEEVETYDRGPDGEVLGPPYFKEKQRVTPPREIKIVQVVIGEDAYKTLRSKTIGGRKAAARDVWMAWSEQGSEISERADSDSKSDGGADVLEDVSASDS